MSEHPPVFEHGSTCVAYADVLVLEQHGPVTICCTLADVPNILVRPIVGDDCLANSLRFDAEC